VIIIFNDKIYSMNSFEGADFLKKKYDLHNAPEVEAAVERTEKRGELKSEKPHDFFNNIKKIFQHDTEVVPAKTSKFNSPEKLIQNYLDRFSEILERQDEMARLRGIDALKHYIHQHNIIKLDEIPESYWELQKRIAKEEGHGDLEINENLKKNYIIF